MQGDGFVKCHAWVDAGAFCTTAVVWPREDEARELSLNFVL